MKDEIRTLNGYRLILEPDHARAMSSDNWQGYVYEHIVVAESALGRGLSEAEVVHHLDGDRANNRSDNLLILDRGQHTKLHLWLSRGAPGVKAMSGKAQEPKIAYCQVCERTLQGPQKHYCSEECRQQGSRRAKRPSPTELKRDMSRLSWLAIGEKYGVSDNATRKWARQYGLLE